MATSTTLRLLSWWASTNARAIWDSIALRNSVIEDLLNYFVTGEPVLPESVAGNPMPRWLGPRLIQVGDHVLEVISVERARNPLFPLVKEAHVAFSSHDDRQAVVPPWREVRSREDRLFYGSIYFTFTSSLSLAQNLSEFAQTVLSPVAEVSYEDGKSPMNQRMDDFLAELKDRNDPNAAP